MNRRHTAENYLKLVDRIRAQRPDLMLSGDFIVGFPGETEADFQATLELVETVRYGQAYSFKYSARPGTPAAERAEVPAVDKTDRLARLQTLLTAQQKEAQNAMVGRQVKVLFEKAGRRQGQLVGKSEYLHAVHVSCGPSRIGEVLPVRITSSAVNSLSGELV